MEKKLEIINVILAELGQDPLPSFNSSEKRLGTVLSFYGLQRDHLQSLFPWKFCTERALLEPYKCADSDEYETPAFDYQYKYKLPDDFLRLYECPALGFNWNSPQEALPPIEGEFILGNHRGPIKAIYIRKVLDEEKWPPVFASAFCCKVAQKSCIKIQQSRALKESLRRDFLEAIADARRIDALQTASVLLPPSVFEKARFE